MHFLQVGPDDLTFTGPTSSVQAGTVATLVCSSNGGLPKPNVTIAKHDGSVLSSGISPQEFGYTPDGDQAEERFLCTSKNIAGSLTDTMTLHIVGKRHLRVDRW